VKVRVRGDGSSRVLAVATTSAMRIKDAKNPATMVIITRRKLLRPTFLRELDPSPMTGSIARFAITPKKIEQALMPINLGHESDDTLDASV
jgi:hypothetical protein